MDPDTCLLHVPPAVLETLSSIMDVGSDTLGWRALAVRILPSYLEVRRLERVESGGGSPTRELLWFWAQQNKTLRDLQALLTDIGHLRALALIQGPATRGGGQAGSQSAASVSLRDVVAATRSFHPETRISEGKFSDLHRAQVGLRTLAVKLIKQTQAVSWKKRWESFSREVGVHHMYQHPNLLEPPACLSDERHHVLLGPYLPNGSLFGRLHPQVQGGGRPTPLTWEQRLNIIKGVAKAVHHLHTALPNAVVCGNISSHNILLDDSLQPRLSDFRLALLRPPAADARQGTVTFDLSSHSNHGYLPQEYLRCNKLTCSLDVHCLGMVIMETVTGRKVTEDGPKKTPLRDLLSAAVESSSSGSSTASVAPCMQFVDEGAGRWPGPMALSLLRVALHCTDPRPCNRPNMEEVLLALSQLLPPPRCPLTDRPPRSLEDQSPSPSPPGPLNQDEVAPALTGPREYSLSEVMYLSGGAAATPPQAPPAPPQAPPPQASPHLYTSAPSECSCTGLAAEPACASCSAQQEAPPHHHYPGLVENEAKTRLRAKVSLYNKGLMDTGGLLSDRK